ncbi:MAG: phospho-N-acetylmuramoyl-pentapeptide-transferase [Alphaproteobacteria bacterium]|nr:phospho-N-acetylmuramoyl-pentapeptide-transferase [Alphaproteobacteria bacterium]
MLYSFLNPYTADVSAFFASLLIMLACGTKFINFMHSWQHDGQPIRDCGPQSHIAKKGTPTMGGLLIIAAVIISTLLFADWHQTATWVCLGVLSVFGATGFFDDYIKVKKHTPDAMTAKAKLAVQFTVAALVACFSVYYYSPSLKFSILIPFLNLTLNLWYFYIPFVMLVIAGTSNAVNLSDGLDGLAAGLLIPVFSVFGVIAFVVGYGYYAFLPFPSISVICSSVCGACMGFLWFNAKPAKIFMGDTGSLALGALLGTIAVLLKQEVLLAVAGIIFVIETLSVMIQVFWYKRTKTRVFLMAPIHHHFEQKGWSETLVVMRFWIIAWAAAVLSLLALVTGGN